MQYQNHRITYNTHCQPRMINISIKKDNVVRIQNREMIAKCIKQKDIEKRKFQCQSKQTCHENINLNCNDFVVNEIFIHCKLKWTPVKTDPSNTVGIWKR